MRTLRISLALVLLALANSVGRAQVEKLPPPTPVAKPAQAAPVQEAHTWSVSCCERTGCASKCEKLWQWVTYRPLTQPGLCACCPRAASCMPPAWTFFIPQNCGKGRCITGSCVSGHCSSDCAREGCGSVEKSCASHSCFLTEWLHRERCASKQSCPKVETNSSAYHTILTGWVHPNECSKCPTTAVSSCSSGSCGTVECPKQQCWTDWLNIGERFGKCWNPSPCEQGVIVTSGTSK